MSMQRVPLFACILTCAALAACALPGSGVTKLTAAEAGTAIHVKQGETVEITLEGNPTTGYTWEVVAGTGDVLAQQGETDFKANSNALGSSGMMTLRFKALQLGTVELKLIYHRTFEPNVPPLRTFDVTVVVDQ